MSIRKIAALILVVSIVIIITIIYQVKAFSAGEEYDIQKEFKNIVKLHKEQKKQEDRALKWAEEMNIDAIDVHYDDHTNNDYQSPEGVVRYLFGTANMGDVDLFSSAFSFETIAEDISEEETIEGKTKMLEDMIKRVTRNQTLTTLKIGSEKNKYDTREVKALLIYTDGKEITLTLDIVSLEEPHSGEYVYYIQTSAWDIIKQIEVEKRGLF